MYTKTLGDSLDDEVISNVTQAEGGRGAYTRVRHIERLRILALDLEGGSGRWWGLVGRWRLYLMGRRLDVLRGRGREAGMHVGGISSRGAGDGNVGGIRAIYWDTGVGVTGGNEGRIVGRTGRGGIGMLLELRAMEIGGRLETVEVYTLADTDLVEIGEVEARETAFEEGIAEGDLALDELCVAAEGESLSVSILLLTGHACGRTGRTFGMLGVALG